ncbi:MAG TPA: hypothetical protein VEY11_20455 [Pyrinomonadaceae bacterium]|nr:hypothetical protein [Pyrinomonadaceae bacterium]
MKIITSLAGILLAAVGGVMAYRAVFIGRRAAALVITETGVVHEVPDTWRIFSGIALLVAGACLAFFALRPRRRP